MTIELGAILPAMPKPVHYWKPHLDALDGLKKRIQRLADFLLDSLRKGYRSIRMTNRKLAEMLGCTRRNVRYLLVKLEGLGLIRCRYGNDAGPDGGRLIEITINLPQPKAKAARARKTPTPRPTPVAMTPAKVAAPEKEPAEAAAAAAVDADGSLEGNRFDWKAIVAAAAAAEAEAKTAEPAPPPPPRPVPPRRRLPGLVNRDDPAERAKLEAIEAELEARGRERQRAAAAPPAAAPPAAGGPGAGAEGGPTRRGSAEA